MYERHFGLAGKPFSLLPDPSFLYMGKRHSSAFAMLEYGIDNMAGFTVISGEIGSGKTTLIRHLLNRLGPEITAGLIWNTHRTFGELLDWVLLAFDIEHRPGDSRAALYRVFIDFMIDQYAQGKRVVLIVDEAQNLDIETLEELRLLSNINADKDQLLQLILVGQPELREKLLRPDLRQFAQRIAVDYHLEPLDEQETTAYIRYRMIVAGGRYGTFQRSAYPAIYKASGGVPRIINMICDTALVYDFGAGRKTVDAAMVEEVVEDRAKGGLLAASLGREPPS